MRLPVPAVVVAAFAVLANPSSVRAQAATPDYYPLKVGSKWNYKMSVMGQSIKATTAIAKTETIDGVKLARLELTLMDKVAATEHLSATDKGVFRNRFNGIEAMPPLTLLKYPPTKGTSWKQDVQVGTEKVSVAAVLGEAEIEVPAGKFKTVSVEMDTFANGMKISTTYWFANGVGIVKQIMTIGDKMILMELESFQGVN